ncbi:Uncharacterised protein [Mycobacterium tuberculosis]|nr:Uncharacterised protein [Mycobacterium tuberculosis]
MPTDPSGLAQLPSHFGHGRSRKALEVVGDGPSVRPDQFLGMGAEQNRNPPIGQLFGGHHTSPHSGPRSGAETVSGIETITWLLVPLIPNADTAAVRRMTFTRPSPPAAA